MVILARSTTAELRCADEPPHDHAAHLLGGQILQLGSGAMTYEPEHLKLWTMPDCYFGEVWPAYYSAGVGQSRDSDALERSNFACMLKAVGGESDTVQVVRESHWA